MKREYRYEVYVAYGYGERERGEVVSRHETIEAAQRKARKSSFWAVRHINDESCGWDKA